MSEAPVTINEETQKQRAFRAAQEALAEVEKKMNAPFDFLKSFGVGGSLITSMVAAISNFFNRMEMKVASLTGQSVTPTTTPSAPTTSPSLMAENQPTVTPPAPTPQVAQTTPARGNPRV